MKVILTFLSGIIFLSVSVNAKGGNSVIMKKLNDTSVFTTKLESHKLVVVGKEWDANKYCNDGTISNPDQLEVFLIDNRNYELSILCTGALDGEENVVSVFSKSLSPKTKRVKPLTSSSRISDQVLNKTVEELIKK